MISIDGPCKDCLVLAICRNKKWFEVPHNCVKFRLAIYNLAKEELETKSSINIRIKPLKREYNVTKSSDGSMMMMGGRL